MDLKLFDWIRSKAPFSYVGAGQPIQMIPDRSPSDYVRAYGQIGWLFGVVSKIASALADVDWKLYRINKTGVDTEVKTHPILSLLHMANPFQTGLEVMELTSMYVDLTGEAFWVIQRNQLGVPAEIWLVPPSRMKVVPSSKDFIKGYVYEHGNQQVPFHVEDVIHIMMPNPYDIYRGIGYVQAMSVELDAEMYANRWNRNFFANSARPDGAIVVPGRLPEADFERLRKQWNEKHQGVGRAHKTAVLQGGADYKQISLSQTDMDFAQLRKMSRDNILGIFGVSLSVMGISESVNRANAEAGEYTFARWVVRPRLTRIREKLNEQLVPQFDKNLRLDFEDPVPENVEFKLKKVESGIKNGVLTVNEGRTALGFPEVSGGNVFLIPLNLISQPVGETVGNRPEGRMKGWGEEQKESYWRTYVSKAEGYERKLISLLRDMFSSQEEDVIEKLEAGRKRSLLDKTQSKKDFEDKVFPVLSAELEEALDEGQLLVRPEPEHRSKQLRTALEWLRSRIGWAAEEVTEVTAKELAETLAEGFEVGERMPELRNRVQNVFEKATRNRAQLIARTETIMASNEGALYGYEEVGVVEKAEFYAALDERTCDDCMALHGEKYPLKEAHGMIPVHPACRCTWIPTGG